MFMGSPLGKKPTAYAAVGRLRAPAAAVTTAIPAPCRKTSLIVAPMSRPPDVRRSSSYMGCVVFPTECTRHLREPVGALLKERHMSASAIPRSRQATGDAAGSSTPSAFLSDINTIRARARQQVLDGAVTPSYGADRSVVLGLLNAALATEIVCVLRYRRHYFMASGAVGEAIKHELLEHANEEQAHADKLAERIVQLGGEPDLNPLGIADRSHSEYVAGDSLGEMVNEDLVAERVAIESYTEMIRYLGDSDPTTRRMLEGILANEEEHAEELASMLETVSGRARR
jgi:bacterioferritin